jgi:hypothetical protein
MLPSKISPEWCLNGSDLKRICGQTPTWLIWRFRERKLGLHRSGGAPSESLLGRQWRKIMSCSKPICSASNMFQLVILFDLNRKLGLVNENL